MYLRASCTTKCCCFSAFFFQSILLPYNAPNAGTSDVVCLFFYGNRYTRWVQFAVLKLTSLVFRWHELHYGYVLCTVPRDDTTTTRKGAQPKGQRAIFRNEFAVPPHSTTVYLIGFGPVKISVKKAVGFHYRTAPKFKTTTYFLFSWHLYIYLTLRARSRDMWSSESCPYSTVAHIQEPYRIALWNNNE